MMPARDFTRARTVLPTQGFAGNPLNRSLAPKKDESFLQNTLGMGTTRVVVIGNSRKIVATKIDRAGTLILQLPTFAVPDLVAATRLSDASDLMDKYTVALLGYDESTGGWVITVDVSDMNRQCLQSLASKRSDIDGELSLEDGRRVLVHMADYNDKALAGQALAMCSWHSVNKFDGVAGLKTRPIESGLKRVILSESGDKQTKLYPRIDPVVIALVISPDGKSILLGNMKAMPRAFYSCLSGFVEPCEAVEESAQREVWEESGVRLQSVKIVGSQPWPIGRGGGCELMIACISLAATTEIEIHDSDVNEVRWFGLPECESLVAESKQNSATAFETRIKDVGQNGVIIPGTYAVAHHLIEKYIALSKSGTLGEWFEELKSKEGSGSFVDGARECRDVQPVTSVTRISLGVALGMLALSVLFRK
jgi:NAD+ diphosphatase